MEDNKVFTSIEEMKARFDDNDIIKKLKAKKQQFLSRGLFVQAMSVQKKIDDTWDGILLDLQNKAIGAKQAADELPTKEHNRVIVQLFAIELMADAFDFIYADIKETFRKHGLLNAIIGFNGIKELAGKARYEVDEMLSYFSQSYVEGYADLSDEIRECILEKTNEIVKRYRPELIRDEEAVQQQH